MPTFKPEVNAAAEFLEISNDFTNPKEIIREGISNAFDSGADEIRITVNIDKTSGEDELVLVISDNGHGMKEEDLQSFFGLGFSTRRQKDEFGRKSSKAIGEKGHGTKIYFNSKAIEVVSFSNGQRIEASLQEPRKSLHTGQLPDVTYSVYSASEDKKGTIITIRGYNNNHIPGFGHDELKDYIYWFTKFGSTENEFEIIDHQKIVLQLTGLGWVEREPEPLRLGHRFA